MEEAFCLFRDFNCTIPLPEQILCDGVDVIMKVVDKNNSELRVSEVGVKYVLVPEFRSEDRGDGCYQYAQVSTSSRRLILLIKCPASYQQAYDFKDVRLPKRENH